MTLHAIEDVPRLGYDVAVVGAGPVGAVTALALARRGSRVLLLEANPKAASRFAGEWLHPPGAAVLSSLDVGALPQCATHPATEGFVVFPDDGSPHIALPYEMRNPGLSCEHSELVNWLREAASAHPRVDYLPNARLTEISDATLTFSLKSHSQLRRVEADRIIGADGRSSTVRQLTGLGDNSRLVSYMAGILLEDVELPCEGFGHVYLGGPGPLLLYRIGARRVRATIDLPLQYDTLRRNPSWLWDTFSPLLPATVKPAFRKALETQRINWAATRFRPRSEYGRGRVSLVGDAAGYFHPLTASGMTIGFLDAQALAESRDLDEYRARREKETFVAELLANAVYQVFVGESESASQVRRAMYDMWRRNPKLRKQTTQILAGAVVERQAFASAFLKVAQRALGLTLEETRERGDWLRVLPRLTPFLPWLEWPAAGLTPDVVRKFWRGDSSATHPFHAALARLAPTPELQGGRVSEPAPARVASPDISEISDALAEQARMALGSDRPGAQTQAARLSAALLGSPAQRPEGQTAPTTTYDIALDLQLSALSVAKETPAVQLKVLRPRLEQLLQCQSPKTGLFARRGERPSTALTRRVLRGWRLDEGLADEVRELMATTQRALEALAAVRRTLPGLMAYEVETALRLSERMLRDAESDLHRVPLKDAGLRQELAARALLALRACGLGPENATVRRLGASLSCTEPATPEAVQQALVLRALLSARVPYLDQIRHRSETLRTTLVDASPISDATWLEVSGVVAEVRAAKAVRPLSAKQSRRSQAPSSLPPATQELGPYREEDWTFCQDSLRRVSRTFSRPIEMLEGDLRRAVTCGYLLCRIADTIEDHPKLDDSTRAAQQQIFLRALEQGRPAPSCEALFRSLNDSSDDVTLVTELPRVLRVFAALPKAMQDAVVPWVAEMARGMTLYSLRPQEAGRIQVLHTVADLERYCYYVAGTVGHLLTELFLADLGDRADTEAKRVMRAHAESFGLGLQFVNILKDVTDDWSRGRSFLPRSCFEAVGLPIEEMLDPAKRELAHQAVAPLFERARKHLDDAMVYTLAIPSDAEAIRLFCLLPLWMAASTLEHGQGNDAMFVPGEAVKISREVVESIILECAEHVHDNAWLEARYAAMRSGEPAAEMRSRPANEGVRALN